MKPTIRQSAAFIILFAISVLPSVFANPADTDANKEHPTKALLDGDRAFQDFAPEYLEIKVLDVQLTPEQDIFNQGESLVKIQAEVLQSYRSAAGLRPGQRIQINFERKNSVGFGDIQPSVPKDGAITVAFLKKEKGESHFTPAAQQYTFVPLSAAQMARLKPQPRKNLVISATTANSGTVEESATVTPEQPVSAPAANSDVQLRPEESSTNTPADQLPTKE